MGELTKITSSLVPGPPLSFSQPIYNIMWIITDFLFHGFKKIARYKARNSLPCRPYFESATW